METTIPHYNDQSTPVSNASDRPEISAINFDPSPTRREAEPTDYFSCAYWIDRRRSNPFGSPNSGYYGGLESLPFPILGLDTEYVQASDGGTTNNLLSYQFCLITAEGTITGIHYPEEGARLKLCHFVGGILQLARDHEMIVEWPEEVCLACHFSIADLPGFSDQEKLFKKLDSVRKTFLTLKEQVPLHCYDRSRHPHPVRLEVRDSMLLAPEGAKSLSALGAILGLEKIELAKGCIERMDELLKSDQPLFERYAIRDAEIAAFYVLRMLALHQKLLGKAIVPTTLSSIGISLLLKSWVDNGIDANDVLGREVVTEKRWNGKHIVPIKKTVSKSDPHLAEALAVECFSGGRGEQYFFGASDIGNWKDFDLCGAYPTALSLLGQPDWDKMSESRSLEDYTPTTFGFARVTFEFPPSTRFPSLPVRTENGLLFPLRGESYCCAPEIYQARAMGARVTIRQGVIFPMDRSVKPFGEFIELTTRERSRHPKGSLENQFWKEMCNATYGKLAQGLRPRRCFDSRNNEYRELPHSRITNPYHAAWVTSFVRAVLAEILAELPRDVSVSNVTTDGILCNASEDQMRACINGPLCDLFRIGRKAITGMEELLEIKNEVKQVLGMRTRGQVTIEPCEGKKIVLAKCGVQISATTKENQNAKLLKRFRVRKVTSKIRCKNLRTLGEICRNGGDLTSKPRSYRALRLDYDFKRRAIDPEERILIDRPHVFFETVPWGTVQEADRCRKEWAEFSKGRKVVMRSLQDFHDFEEYRAIGQRPDGLRRPPKGGVRKIAVRMFLRALCRDQLGLEKNLMSYSEVAGIITSLGVKTSREDVENAARKSSIFLLASVPRTAETVQLFVQLRQQFPLFEYEALLEPEGEDECINPANGSVQECISLLPSHDDSTPKAA